MLAHVLNKLLENKIPLSNEDFHQLLFCLFNDKTKKINLSETSEEHWNDYQDRFEIMMEKISKRAPNLQELAIRFERGQFIPPYPPPLVNVTCPMIRLQSFTCIGWLWSDRDLERLVQMMPNLVALKVTHNVNIFIGDMVLADNLFYPDKNVWYL